ncbi:MAG: hypothetical protein GXP28_11555 [Planctomycetes bacterium]|nr:hypothetical protein [Planctomycetota bacterium]
MSKVLTRLRVLLFFVAVLATLEFPLNALAEQQVTLQSGAVLVGQLTMDGENLVLDIDGAKLRVPFRDVATVTSTKTNSGNQAQRLLLKGLEAQLLFDSDQRALGLFAEAYRLSPEDVGVAFWHARSLAGAGYGKAASEVLQPRREEIAAAYPSMVDRLATLIELRLALEMLPAALLKRIDQIDTSISYGSPLNHSESDFFAIYFQLVDQNGKPIAKSAFRVHDGGQNENLESFAKGYHLYTFNRRRSRNSQPSRVEVLQVGLANKPFEFQASRNEVKNSGVFTVRRFTEEDRQKIDALIVDSQGKPLAGATVTFSPYRSRNRNHKTPVIKTDDTGHASAKLYPGQYNCTVTAEGYTRGAKRIEVLHEKQDSTPIKMKIYRQIATTVKVVWRSWPMLSPYGQDFPEETVAHGETQLHTGALVPNNNQSDPNGGIRWMTLVQSADRMKLLFHEQPTQRQPNLSVRSTWVGCLTDTSKTSAFDAIDLKKLDEFKERVKFPHPNLGGRHGRQPAVAVPVEKGAIYLGRISAQNPQTGQPALVEFKLLFVEVSDPHKSKPLEP